MELQNMKKKRSTMPFILYNIDSIPDNAIGIYGFWFRKNGKCIYVGKAEKQPIKKRLRQHWRKSHNLQLQSWIREFREFLDICYLPVKCKKKINKMEVRLIRAWRPETNIIHRRR